MNTDHINIPEDNFNIEGKDIEQMLRPQCEFKTSDTLKEMVMARAREEMKPHREVRIWPWVAAACVAGFLMLWLTPPEEKKADHVRLVSVNEARRQRAIYDRESVHESFEDIERRMRNRGNQLREEIGTPNQIYY